jgi:hypothetical protein
MGPQIGRQGGIEGRINQTGGQQAGVDRPVDQGRIHKHRRAVGTRVVAGIDEGDQAAIGIDPVRQDMAPN